MLRLKTNTETSNIWYILIIILIFHFLYYYLIIHTNLVLNCSTYDEFWFSANYSQLELIRVFLIIFLLFALWIMAEIYSSFKSKTKDRKFCYITGSLLLIYIAYLLISFKAFYEYHEIKNNERKYENFTFQIYSMLPNPIKNSWDKFVWEKQCKNPDYYRNFRSPEDVEMYWENLLTEYLENGGTLEEFMQSNPKIQLNNEKIKAQALKK